MHKFLLGVATAHIRTTPMLQLHQWHYLFSSCSGILHFIDVSRHKQPAIEINWRFGNVLFV